MDHSQRDNSASARQRLQSATNGDDAIGSVVKMMAERVYSHMKLEFSEDKPNLSRIKKALLQATDDVLPKVTESYSVSIKGKERVSDVSEAKEKEKSPEPTIVVIPLLLPKYTLHFSDSIPHYTFSFAILNSKENVKKGIIIDGEYTTYEISSIKVPIRDGGRKTVTRNDRQECRYHVERRSSEMKKLHAYLHKLYPFLIVPPFPSKVVSLQKDTVVEHRKRVFSLWLAYVANDSVLQHDNDIISFVSGISSTSNEWPIGESVSSQEGVDAVRFCRFYKFADPQRYLSAASNEIQVLRDMHAIKRDMKRLLSDSAEAFDACRSVLHGFTKVRSSIRLLQQDVASLEGLDVADTPLAQVLSPGLALADDCLSQTSALFSTHLFDTLSFLYDSLLPCAGDLCDKVTKQLPNQLAPRPVTPVLLDEHSPLCDDEDDDPRLSSLHSSSKAIKGDSVRQAMTFIRSYDYYSKFRAFTVFQNLRDLAATMVDRHARSRKEWMSVKRSAAQIVVDGASDRSHSKNSSSNRPADVREQAAQSAKAAWSYVRTFMDRPIIPSGFRKPPATQRYSNRNHGVTPGSAPNPNSNMNTPEPPVASPRVGKTPSTPANAQTPAPSTPAASTSSKGIRKMQRPAGAAGSAAGKVGTGDFFVKAPAPAATLSSTAPSVAHGAPQFAFATTDSSFTSRAYATEPGIGVRPEDLPDPTADVRPEPKTQPSSAPAKAHHPARSHNVAGAQKEDHPAPAAAAAAATTATATANDLPEGWMTSVTDDGRTYYYNVHTRVSRWDAPTEEVAAAVRERVQKAKGVVDEAVQRRKQEIKEQQQQQEATKQAAAAVRPEIQKALQLWRRPKNWQRDRDIGELLSSLHTIVCSVTAEMIVGDKVLTAQSPAADIKKAYLRAARQIHPDKFTAEMVLEERLIAEEVFVVLTDEYNAFKKAHDLV